jgi:very-short-patch-repair endonuclease
VGARSYAAGETLRHSEKELRILEQLNKVRIPVIHQQVFKTPWGAIAVDFYFPTKALVVEFDGPEHRNSTKKDRKRDEFLKTLGINTIRVIDTTNTTENIRAVFSALANSSV